jgi:hypothetical protein
MPDSQPRAGPDDAGRQQPDREQRRELRGQALQFVDQRDVRRQQADGEDRNRDRGHHHRTAVSAQQQDQEREDDVQLRLDGDRPEGAVRRR